ILAIAPTDQLFNLSVGRSFLCVTDFWCEQAQLLRLDAIGQSGSPKQVVFLLARWKQRGFFSDSPSERCDAILERSCLLGKIARLHSASPQLEWAGAQPGVII